MMASLLTPSRLQPYYQSVGNFAQAMELYEWNINASMAILGTIARIEVLARNSMDQSLIRGQRLHHENDWLDSKNLDSTARARIQHARQRSRRHSLTQDRHRVISELSFGFWRSLASTRYLTTLWVPCLKHAFPGGASDPLTRQEQVHDSLQRLVYVRNRAVHHEPIHNRNLMLDHNTAVNLASMIDPVAGEWIEMRSTIPMVVAKKPETST
jgi:hypothetical protein